MQRGRIMCAVRSLLGGILLVVLVGCAVWLLLPARITEPVRERLRGDTELLAEAKSDKPAVRVLFVGNSLTYFNDMPAMIRELAAAGGQLPFVSVQETPGGCTLEQHWASGRAVRLLDEARWNYVVLQEQSQRPSWSKLRARQMYPYARLFCTRIREAGANPVFFLTWGGARATRTIIGMTPIGPCSRGWMPATRRSATSFPRRSCRWESPGRTPWPVGPASISGCLTACIQTEWGLTWRPAPSTLHSTTAVRSAILTRPGSTPPMRGFSRKLRPQARPANESHSKTARARSCVRRGKR